MTLEDSWGGDITTAAIAHLAHSTFHYMVYPNRDHGLREGSGTLVHFRTLIIRYLLEHLPPGPK